MVAIVADGVSFCHSTQSALLDRVSFRVDAGFHGLVGENGAGKSTLLAMLAGRLRPHAGSIRWLPGDVDVAMCPQTVELDDEVGAFAASTSAVAARLRGRLGVGPLDLGAWDSLSPGERRRWQIGAALSREPDVLLLDEPTNHLDREARVLLLAALREHRGVGVVVSHDRAWLDALTISTLRVHAGSVTHHAGPYSKAREDWLRAALDDQRRRDALSLASQRAAERLDAARRDQAAADRARSVSTRMKGPRDSDARGALAKGRAAAAEARSGRSVEVRRAAAQRANDALAAHGGIARALGGPIRVAFEPAPTARVLSFDADHVSIGGRAMLRDVHLSLARGARVRLEGSNGAGKTTLLNAMIEASSHAGARVVHVPQELDDAQRAQLLDDVRALPADRRGAVMSLVAALGTQPARLLSSGCPSPGEAKKLLLARALGSPASALVLDEPTNHLDLPTVERVEAALRDYTGAILLVTHDDAFAAACTRDRWRIEHGRVLVC